MHRVSKYSTSSQPLIHIFRYLSAEYILYTILSFTVHVFIVRIVYSTLATIALTVATVLYA